MSGEWYVDPVGRFDGRFFDGSEWTDQVSDGGVLRTDGDWPPQFDGAASVTVDARDNSQAGRDEAVVEQAPVESESTIEAAAVARADAEAKGAVGTRRMSGVERRDHTDRRRTEVPVAYENRSGERRQIDAIIEPERY